MQQRQLKYNIKVEIHELQNCRFSESGKDIIPNPFVEVCVLNERKTTPKRQQTASVTFNSQFNFAVTVTPDDLALSTIDVTVYHAYMFTNAVIGSAAVSCTYVHNKPQHWLYREWVPLRHSGNPAEPTGYILLTVGVFGAGDAIPVVEEEHVTQSAGGEEIKRVTGAPELKFQSFNLIVNIHRGHDIVIYSGATPSPFVRVKHGGFSEVTRVLTGSTPEWNTSFLLPAFIPSYDDHVLLELGQGTPDASGMILGVRSLQFQHLLQKPQEPVWLNFYYKPVPLDLLESVGSWFQKTYPSGSSVPIGYAGRLLVSANVQKVQVVSPPSTRPAPATPEPPITEYALFTDIYEITSTVGKVGRIQVELAVGIYSQKTPLINYVQESYICDDQLGRLEPAKLYLPPLHQVCDIFLYVIGSMGGNSIFGTEELRRIAFAQIPFAERLGFDSKPWWCVLRSVETGDEAFSVLITLHYGLTKDAPIERPPRLTYNLKSYVFRCMIYEGVNIPCFSETVLPSAYVKVELAGRSATTRAVEHHLNPAWYEAFEIEVALPDNLSLAPGVNVEVLSAQQSGFTGGGAITLGHFTFPITRIPVLWDVYPEWQDLRSRSDIEAHQQSKGKILCSFELLPSTTSMLEKYPFFDDIRPSTYPATVHLFLIGVRMFKDIRDPAVTIAYGRDFEHSLRYLWADESGPPAQGQGGNWNFLKEVQVNVALPKRHIHNAVLELTVTEKLQGFGGERRDAQGTCYIGLTPNLPWLTEDERAAAAETFKLWTLEEALLDATDAINTASLNPTNLLEKLSTTGDKIKESLHARRRMTVAHQDLEAANCQVCSVDDYLACDDENEELEERKLLQNLGRTTPNHLVQKQLSKLNSIKELKKRKTMENDFGPYRSLMNFDLLLPDGDDDDDGTNLAEQREEIPHGFEADIDATYLPYQTASIVKSTAAGLPETVGYIKYLCSVYAPTTTDEEKQAFCDGMDRIRNQYTETRNLVVRAYLLSARGLIPPSGSSEPQIYVWIRNGEDEAQSKSKFTLPHSIRDVGNVRRQGFRPEFNRCYALQCALPDHAILRVALINTQGLSEELVGATYIDVEDRWFSPKFQWLLQRACVPVEQRTLKLEGRVMSQGSLRLWVELMTYETSLAKPTTVLASPDPEPYQLRLIIWAIQSVPLQDNASLSLFVRGTYQLDNGTPLTQDTDIHYNSRDGSARFNWRFVWDIVIPAQQPVVKLQIFNSQMFLQGAEPLSECNIDLSYDFHAARKRYTTQHNISATWYRCSHPAKPGEDQGMIHAEIALLPAKEAEFAPVGKGRDEPNRKPYLEPVTENRTYVDWKYVGEQVASVATSMVATARYGCIITAVVFVVGGILLLIIVLR